MGRASGGKIKQSYRFCCSFSGNTLTRSKVSGQAPAGLEFTEETASSQRSPRREEEEAFLARTGRLAVIRREMSGT